ERRVLVIADDAAERDLLVSELSRRQFEVVAHPTSRALEAAADADVVLADLDAREPSDAALHSKLVALGKCAVVLMTPFAGVETAVSAIRAGAYDFVTKPLSFDDVALTLERAFEKRELQQEVSRLREQAIVQDPARLLPMEEIEHRYVEHVLAAVQGNKA